MTAGGQDRRWRPAEGDGPRGESQLEVVLRLVQGALGLWLLVSVVLLEGAPMLIAAKDVLAGGVLLTVTVAAAAGGAAQRIESAVCLAVGVLLIAGSVLLEFGAGPQAVASQWNEVVVGVLLVCVAAARGR